MGRLTEYTRDGLRFDVTDVGPEDGPLVVLLHGFPGDRTSWREVLPGLIAAGVRCVVPDQRGYSPRARPAGRAPYRGRELVADVTALLDALGAERAHVVGHDWGGAVAWQLATTAPERVASLTVLSTPHPAALTRAMTRSRQPLRSLYMGLFQVPVLPELVLRRLLAPMLRSTGLPDPWAREYAARMAAPGALTGALAWYRALVVPGRGRRRPRTSGSRSVTVPTVYLWGSRDTALGRWAAEATADHVTGPYRFLEVDESHWLPETAPRLVTETVLEAVRG
ncbi:alpha/beta fold hydrolase [Auraticoccus monumenti]|uniref:Pimeloyl-ACP methyl ester carboxylesterase n=1 Tax=Auraticoccus monumenti TaxID=675864 RepID=A0A1G6YX48_9ACTN|nr:alpha/beta hydrolase [Auraticoccus monumenti]SDD94215.1 Pimeloyl-ACP methyl ester carboxylesterase [Auraticoccus monumenti]